MKIDSLKKLYANYHNIKIVWFNVSHVITCDSMSSQISDHRSISWTRTYETSLKSRSISETSRCITIVHTKEKLGRNVRYFD